MGQKYRSKPNHFDKFKSACLDVFGFHGFKVDLSSEENEDKFKPYVLHYKLIAGKIQKAKENAGKSVFHKFPDSQKLFFTQNDDNTFIKQQVAAR